jgi:hypothetical protein
MARIVYTANQTYTRKVPAPRDEYKGEGHAAAPALGGLSVGSAVEKLRDFRLDWLGFIFKNIKRLHAVLVRQPQLEGDKVKSLLGDLNLSLK